MWHEAWGGRIGPNVRSLAVAALAALVALPGTLSAQTVPAASVGTVSHGITLSRLGYPDGISMTSALVTRDLYFPGAPAVPVSDGVLRLRLTAEMQDFRYSFLRVDVNDVPRRSIRLEEVRDSTFVLEIPLAAGDVTSASIHVALRFGGRLVDDVCYDPRTNGSFVRVEPESGVYFRYAPGRVRNVTETWRLLPRRVAVAVPSQEMSPSGFRGAWELGATLERDGHLVRYVRLPGVADVEAVLEADVAQAADDDGWVPGSASALAHFLAGDSATLARVAANGGAGVVIAAGSETLAALAGASEGASGLAATDDGAANVRLARVHGWPVIVADDPLPDEVAGLMGSEWRSLANDAAALARLTREEPGLDRSVVRFSDAGIPPIRTQVIEVGQWEVTFSVRTLPPGRMPDAVRLDIVAGLSPRRDPMVLHAFLNDVLIESLRIADTGEPQRIRLRLPARRLAIDNRLVLQVQRPRPEDYGRASDGECWRLPAGSPAQLLDASLLFTDEVEPGGEFYEILSELRRGYEAWLPEAYLERPMDVLPFLARAGATALPLGPMEGVRFYGSAGNVSPTGPFVLVGDGGGSAVDAAVQVSDGRVTLDVGTGVRVVDVASRPATTLVQIASAEGQAGLWIHPLGDGVVPPPRNLFLSSGNVALVTAQGVDLAYDSRIWEQDQWLWLVVLLERYRFILIGFGILAAGVVLVFLLRRWRRSRTDREAAEEKEPAAAEGAGAAST